MKSTSGLGVNEFRVSRRPAAGSPPARPKPRVHAPVTEPRFRRHAGPCCDGHGCGRQACHGAGRRTGSVFSRGAARAAWRCGLARHCRRMAGRGAACPLSAAFPSDMGSKTTWATIPPGPGDGPLASHPQRKVQKAFSLHWPFRGRHLSLGQTQQRGEERMTQRDRHQRVAVWSLCPAPRSPAPPSPCDHGMARNSDHGVIKLFIVIRGLGASRARPILSYHSSPLSWPHTCPGTVRSQATASRCCPQLLYASSPCLLALQCRLVRFEKEVVEDFVHVTTHCPVGRDGN
jgi:hypothetical protein